MTDDVARKAVSANGYNNGTKTILMPNRTTNGKLVPDVNRIQTVDELETRYTDRFDDVRYYTGDSASG